MVVGVTEHGLLLKVDQEQVEDAVARGGTRPTMGERAGSRIRSLTRLDTTATNPGQADDPDQQGERHHVIHEDSKLNLYPVALTAGHFLTSPRHR